LGKSAETKPKKYETPALTLETRVNQLAAASWNKIEQRIREDKATAQELIFFAKLGSPEEKLKRKLLECQAELAQAKADAIKQEKQNAELIEQAMAAFKDYSGESYEDPESYQDVYVSYDV
jgi:hypothetical protein